MQARSGCRIQIDQDVPNGAPRKVIISAQSDEQVRLGVEIVTNVMQNGPRRDMGGGAGGFHGQSMNNMQQQQHQYAQFYQMQQMQYAQYYQQQMQQQYGGFHGYG